MLQDVQKGRPARPQRAQRRGGTYQASLELLAPIRCERRVTLPQVPPPNVEPLSDARTKLEDFFNILLGLHQHFDQLMRFRRFPIPRTENLLPHDSLPVHHERHR